MATAHAPRRSAKAESARAPQEETIADLLRRLGDIPANRVRLHPTPGTATVRDVTRVNEREDRLCELVEGTLVEKPMGYEESVLAGLLITLLNNFVLPRKLGKVAGEAGMMLLTSGLVRLPDVSFASRATLRACARRKDPAPPMAPDLAVEVLSKSNTKAEIARKLREYFAAGTRLAWIVEAKKRTVRVHTSPTDSTQREAGGTLDGGDVLPGFALRLRELFGALDED